MLTDLGLQNQEQIDNYYKYLSERAIGKWGGCISSRLCKSCNHLISDSVCLCINSFTCPNCGFKNEDETKMINFAEEKYNNYGFFIGEKAVSGLYTKNDFIKLIDKVFNSEEKYEPITKDQLIKEIEKL